MSDWRSRVAFTLPAALAFVPTAIDARGTLIDRIMVASVAAVVVGAGAVIGMAIAIASVHVVLGKDVEEPSLTAEKMAAGMLLAAFVWVWWQADRDTAVRRIAACVDQVAMDEPGMQAGAAVRWCYEQTNTDARDDQR